MKTEIEIKDKTTESASKFRYLANTVSASRDNKLEIRTKMERARSVFLNMRNLFTLLEPSLDWRIKIAICFVFPMLMYSSKHWILVSDSVGG